MTTCAEDCLSRQCATTTNHESLPLDDPDNPIAEYDPSEIRITLNFDKARRSKRIDDRGWAGLG